MIVSLSIASGVAEAAPLGDLQVRTVTGGTLTADDLAGRVVLLDFWATWCAPCLAELPELSEAWERYGERGFTIVGVSLDQGTRRELAGFLRRQEIGWPQLHDGRGFGGELARRFGVQSIPRSFLFDREGRLVARDLDGEALLAALPGLVQDPGPDPAVE